MGTHTVTISKSAFSAFLGEVAADFGISEGFTEEGKGKKEYNAGDLIGKIAGQLDDKARFRATEAGLRSTVVAATGSEALPSHTQMEALAEQEDWRLPRLGSAPWLQQILGALMIGGLICLFIWPLYALGGLVLTGFAAWWAERNGTAIQSRNLKDYVHAIAHVNYDRVVLGDLPALEPETVLLGMLSAHAGEALRWETQLVIK